jgi:hypothetical protein
VTQIKEGARCPTCGHVSEAVKLPDKPLHEMSDFERDNYANEAWGRILGRPAK